MATEKRLNEPLPCCGLTPWGFEIECDYGLVHYRLHCPVCKKHLTERNKERAIERWDKRVVSGLWQLKKD